ncbi:LysR substrate-binding domain-containing protein [Microvirga guangxiensis]|uniref:DNA-binding transcriptional regulator, LysR family n=1 Tax=Microvirga guangxiensis TaxID=549386 RepID=A0A1G5HLY2_9HYPH|nr:LysR substrate-binding domain-containing protein [Microvirga guangxiensis]SCY64786.1 DNA-binding transcriptional regulator, LysR family [Microvirga guangxiensis]
MDHTSPALPPLDALRAFEAAARLGSFSAAASDLHLTHGAISRQVAKLEHWLGERLFDRRARGVVLTPQGQRLHQRTSEAFALIADSSDRWVERRGAAIVRLTTIPSISSLWLMPRLKAFESGNPSLRIEFVVEHRNTDLEVEGIDLAIRCGRGSLPGRVSVRLFEEHCFPIASPDLAGSLGTGAPERVLEYPLVHDSDASGWRAWFAAQGMDYRPRPQDRRFEDYNLVLDAAAHGLGVALARPPLAGEALRSGRVVAVDRRTALNPVSYWLDRPASRLRPSAAELARRIMVEAMLSDAMAETFLKA